METVLVACFSLVKWRNYKTFGVVVFSLFLLTLIICNQYTWNQETGLASTLVRKNLIPVTVLKAVHDSKQRAAVAAAAEEEEEEEEVFPITIDAAYVLENPTLCTAEKNLSVLIIVHTAPDFFQRRQLIRKTWANNTYYQKLGTVRTLFLLGTTKDALVQNQIEGEFRVHGDLLQGSFVDNYRNLTHKGVMAFKWISERCTHAGMILKVDDDVIVNTYRVLTEVVPRFRSGTKHIRCPIQTTVEINRDKFNKWYVKESDLKGRTLFPRYCSGFTVMMSTDLPALLCDAARRTPFLWVDDVYLYGLLPDKVGKVWYEDFVGHFSLIASQMIECLEDMAKTCQYLVVGELELEADSFETIWKLMGEAFHIQRA